MGGNSDFNSKCLKEVKISLKISSKISVTTKKLQQKSWYFVVAVEMYFSMYLIISC